MWGDAGTSPEHRDVLGCQGNTITPDNTDVSSKLHARRILKQTNKAFCFPLVIKPMVWVTVAKVWLGVLLHVIRPGKPRAWLMPRIQPSWLYPCNFLPQVKSKNGQQKNLVKMQGRILLLNVAVSSKCRQLSQYTNCYSFFFLTWIHAALCFHGIRLMLCTPSPCIQSLLPDLCTSTLPPPPSRLTSRSPLGRKYRDSCVPQSQEPDEHVLLACLARESIKQINWSHIGD